jgi:hypothetical protein
MSNEGLRKRRYIVGPINAYGDDSCRAVHGTCSFILLLVFASRAGVELFQNRIRTLTVSTRVTIPKSRQVQNDEDVFSWSEVGGVI